MEIQMTDLIKKHQISFENLKHFDEDGHEFWLARELYPLLEYARWDAFRKVIERAKKACVKSNIQKENHFRLLTKMVQLGYGSERLIEDIALSRYACYLIVQNGDPSKPIIAAGQTYFAIQTRRQELSDEEQFQSLSENERRMMLRSQMKVHNKELVDAAHNAGVETKLDYAIFQNYGYKGLYNGMDKNAIHSHKGLTEKQQILDYMGSEELAANLFRATQTEAKLRRENIQGKKLANLTHYNVGKKVRETIKDLGGTMPEDLPTPTKSIQQLESELKRTKKLINKK